MIEVFDPLRTETETRVSGKVLTLAIVSCSSELLRGFFNHHSGVLSVRNLEVLVFCEKWMNSEFTALLSCNGLSEFVRLISDGIPSGPNRKRNRLLAEAKGEYIAFLDDDSVFLEPEKDIARLLAYLSLGTADWVLCTACYTGEGRAQARPPKAVAFGSPGSGIEWNQVIRTEAMRKVGGWSLDFCTGERWKSGGMLDLAFRLRAHGYRQACLASVTVAHPQQLGGDEHKALRKGLAYRYAIGAILASNSRDLHAMDMAAWFCRLLLLAPLAGFVEMARGRKVEAQVKLLTPMSVARGWCDFKKNA